MGIPNRTKTLFLTKIKEKKTFPTKIREFTKKKKKALQFQ